jgi:methyl-accepting chemotaxis protein
MLALVFGRTGNADNTRLTRQILLPLFAAILVVGALTAVAISWQAFARREAEERVFADHLRLVIGHGLKAETDKLAAAARTAMEMASLRDAYLAGDRDAVVKVAGGLFADLKAAHSVTHFYIHAPDRKNFVRVHNPKQHGDMIDRTTLLKAQQTGAQAAGVEMGASGLFTLRVVLPWRHAGALIGYLEFGEEIDHVLTDIKTATRIGLDALVAKPVLKREAWEANARAQGGTASWDQFATHALVSGNDRALPVELLRALLEESSEGQDPVHARVGMGGRTLRVSMLPFHDAAGKDVARLAATVDVTEDTHAFWLLMGATLVGIAVAGVGVVVIFRRAAGTVQAHFDESHAKLVTEKEEAQRLAAEQSREQAAKEQRAAAIARLVQSFEASVVRTLDTVTAAAKRLDRTAQDMAATAEQTNGRVAASAAAAEQTSLNVQSVASASRQMAATLQEISSAVRKSSAIAGTAVREADETNVTVNSLSEAAQKIGDVVNLISKIASQTNLLALNATIEAARAGEAGKGFAVVASEVKNLANQTSKATEEISAQVAAMQQVTGGAVAAIQDIGRTIGSINDSTAAIAGTVDEQTAATSEIARNVEQAAQGTEEVSTNIVQVTRSAREARQAADQVLDAANELTRQSDTLRQEVERFLAGIRAA